MAPTVRKISLAIGREELKWARARAKRENTSVSAVLTEAARAAREAEALRAKQRAAWATFLDWATDGKGLRDDEIEAAARELGPTP
jgi:hypothetical protein